MPYTLIISSKISSVQAISWRKRSEALSLSRDCFSLPDFNDADHCNTCAIWAESSLQRFSSNLKEWSILFSSKSKQNNLKSTSIPSTPSPPNCPTLARRSACCLLCYFGPMGLSTYLSSESTSSSYFPYFLSEYASQRSHLISPERWQTITVRQLQTLQQHIPPTLTTQPPSTFMMRFIHIIINPTTPIMILPKMPPPTNTTINTTTAITPTVRLHHPLTAQCQMISNSNTAYTHRISRMLVHMIVMCVGAVNAL